MVKLSFPLAQGFKYGLKFRGLSERTESMILCRAYLLDHRSHPGWQFWLQEL